LGYDIFSGKAFNAPANLIIETRNKGDFCKAFPKLLLPSIQVNIRAGKFGVAEENKVQYIKIPLNKI
jgi:hypothetical protein